MMRTAQRTGAAALALTIAFVGACAPTLRGVPEGTRPAAALPDSFALPASAAVAASDTLPRSWRAFFTEPELVRLIETALAGNQEINILVQEVEIARAEASGRRGEYLPSVRGRVGAGAEKAGEYTRAGAVEHQLEIAPGEEFPDPLTDYVATAEVSWEVDIWGRLRKETKAAVLRYAATAEGRNFAVSRLVAEIARTYYELVALDQRLAYIDQTIRLQQDALAVVQQQKDAGRATELAVRRFEAEVQKNLTERTVTRQEIVEVQNRMSFLIGAYPAPIARSAQAFSTAVLPALQSGTPADLLRHRPDVRQAELELSAASLDVQAARARFYPAVGVAGALGVQSFEVATLMKMPASLLYGVAADITVPIFNRRAIAAAYRTANARQLQALYEYQRTLLGAFTEVSTQLSRIRNLDSGYVAKARQVEALVASIEISTQLYRSARADYLEVLLTQREALESRIELVEIRQRQLDARVTAFQALGGGSAPAVTAEVRAVR